MVTYEGKIMWLHAFLKFPTYSLWGGDYNTIVSPNRRPWADHLELLNLPPFGERQEVLVNPEANDCWQESVVSYSSLNTNFSDSSIMHMHMYTHIYYAAYAHNSWPSTPIFKGRAFWAIMGLCMMLCYGFHVMNPITQSMTIIYLL